MKYFVILIIATLTLGSCSPYQDVLKSDDIKLKYTTADSLYNNGKYKKALQLWEQIVPLYRGRPQAERVMYLYSDTFYQLEDYYLSGYQFERFVNAYPQSEKRAEAAFKSAESYYNLSPSYNLDQADTYKAMDKLQVYLNVYPDSEHVDKVNAMIQELQNKLEKKAFEIAKGYNKIGANRGTFPNAIKAFENFLSEYPGSIYREEALFWKFDSSYQLALGSIDRLMQERLVKAVDAYDSYVKYFPEGKFIEQATEMKEEIIERLAQFDNLTEE